MENSNVKFKLSAGPESGLEAVLRRLNCISEEACALESNLEGIIKSSVPPGKHPEHLQPQDEKMAVKCDTIDESLMTQIERNLNRIASAQERIRANTVCIREAFGADL